MGTASSDARMGRILPEGRTARRPARSPRSVHRVGCDARRASGGGLHRRQPRTCGRVASSGGPRGEPLEYRDLGLPPMGAPAWRLAGASLPDDEVLFDLEALPPAALVSYVMRHVLRAVPG